MTMQETHTHEISPRFIHRVNRMMKERVFFIKCGEFVRISRSASSPKWVLSGMQPFCPYEMTIIKEFPGGHKLQRELEKVFAGYRHNSLWFRYEGSLKTWLESVNA